MEDNATRHSLRAAAGLSKAIRQEYVPPDTHILGPDGTLRILGRRAETLDPVIAFRKSNPARRNAKSGKRPPRGRSTALGGAPFGRGVKAGGSGGGPLGGFLQGPMELLGRIPLMNVLVTAALAHRVWSLVTRRLFGGDGRKTASSSSSSAAAAAQRGGDRQLARRNGDYDDDDDDEDDEYDMDEHAEELLSKVQHASMLPAMLRSSLPRPHRTSLAKRAAQQYHSRQRSYRTAHQMLHGGPAGATGGSGSLGAGSNGGGGGGAGRPGQGVAGGTGRRQAQRRPLGKLEKMDLIVRQQIRAAMLAQQRQQEQELLLRLQQQQPELAAGPSGAASLQQQPSQRLLHQRSDHACPAPSGQLVLAATSGNSGGSRGPYPPANRTPLHPGPPPPPAFRPLPPELRARLHGVRQPGAVAMAPAARAAAAGPPPLGEEEELAGQTSHAGAGSVQGGQGLGGSGRHSPGRTWVAEPPPFGVASPRFASEIRKDIPDYHVAYRDVTQPPRWTAKELLALQRRRVVPEPGPGAYEPRDTKHHRRFRRPHDQHLDGPFFLDQVPDGMTTRSREIAALLRAQGDSGLGPGDYDGIMLKDKVMRNAPVYKLGTVDREGKAPHAKSLSISRSIQNGIDWHVPVIVQPASAGAASATTPPGEVGPSSSTAVAIGGDDAGSPTSTVGPAASTTTRPSTAERVLGLYSGGGSRSGSPTGTGSAEHYVGVPPPPPSQVSRAVRRDQQRRPGDWDWNRLGANYRTSWTTLHGGAYSHGDHSAPRSAPSSAPATVRSTATSNATMAQGIYPIIEESSSGLQRDAPAENQPYLVASFAVAPGGEQAGVPQAGGSTRVKGGLISDDDMRRRREAAELANKAQLANTRVADWQSKFAG
ncbi:hypothetical protein VOLCADRAFT_108232 [Volvox carteri f. nagariensis]|uniref:Uncharacterized protein n=1 Tax=Volvox carteri f. nagariensis TaxID=3068 RepID=D8UJ13_VOLCA|nr:uncharacterized protein VOLCADRAFT_108232 [Volvox carteri f. nagariensis]EFJ40294.1 hypothetical protein VOLCADRAFT_108232 [Volvox carteri f. nagariensis]|eukprot:XP_002958628.1 hypothetical protein VOLCADRAFT_108232 [Volvox carteri f. nagariensis]